jgi:hypothetical protein
LAAEEKKVGDLLRETRQALNILDYGKAAV